MNEGMYAVYRSKREDGTRCQRGIRVHDDRVEIRAGETGAGLELIQLSREDCLNEDPWTEMRWRRSQWISEGFVRVGYGDCPNGWLNTLYEVGTADLEAEPKDEKVALHWAAPRHFRPVAIEGLFLDLAKALENTGHVVAAEILHSGGRCGLNVETPNRLWTIRRRPDGLLAEAGKDGAARLFKADGVVPFLVLMRIEREFPGTIEFFWLEQSDAWRVQPNLSPSDPYLGERAGPYQDTLRVAEALGLRPATGLLANEVENDHPIFF